MYVIEKKIWMGFSFYGDQSLVGYSLVDGKSIIYPVSCEEDFLLRLGWVLMITKSHHKRKTIEAQR